MESPDSINQCFLLTINFPIKLKNITLPIKDVAKSEYRVQKAKVYHGTAKGNKYEIG